MFDATWGDADWDILEDFESHFGANVPVANQERVTTFGQFLEMLWSQAQKSPHQPTEDGHNSPLEP
jgi:hypothetical protein